MTACYALLVRLALPVNERLISTCKAASAGLDNSGIRPLLRNLMVLRFYVHRSSECLWTAWVVYCITPVRDTTAQQRGHINLGIKHAATRGIRTAPGKNEGIKVIGER